MKALTVVPLKKESLALIDVPEPQPKPNEMLVEMLRVGICGTDREIIDAEYGKAPQGRERLILGHESLGRVISAPEGCGFARGDLVVGIVRHPDPVPCGHCAVGEWDMCSNGLYEEHGIQGRDGFCQERYALDPQHAVKVDRALGEAAILLEPATVLAKAWEQIERIGHRSVFFPRKVLVTGAGPVGLLAAWMGIEKNLEVHVLDHNQDGIKPKLVQQIGARYESDLNGFFETKHDFDIVIECTGAPELFLKVLGAIAPGGIVCLTGVSTGGRLFQVDSGKLNREIVLENEVIFGSVNANRRHYEQAAASLSRADPKWLSSFITHRTPLAQAPDAYGRTKGTIKNVIVGGAI